MASSVSRFLHQVSRFLGQKDTVPLNAPDARLSALQAEMKKTKMGRAVVSYLEQQAVQVSFDLPPDSREGGRFEPSSNKDLPGAIRLNPGFSNDELTGILAHEARHVWQARQLGPLYHGKEDLPPEAAIGINRFLEADAFATQEAFLEERAAKGQGLEARAQFRAGAGLPAEGPAQGGFNEWQDLLRAQGHYDAQTIQKLTMIEKIRKLESMGSGGQPTRHVMSPDKGPETILAAAHALAQPAPFGPVPDMKAQGTAGLLAAASLPANSPLHPAFQALSKDYASHAFSKKPKAGFFPNA